MSAHEVKLGTDRVPICHQHPHLTVSNLNLVGLEMGLYTYPAYVGCGSNWPQQDSEVCLGTRRRCLCLAGTQYVAHNNGRRTF